VFFFPDTGCFRSSRCGF